MTAERPPALSLVVVSFEMARELPRTLLSLAPPYQAAVPGGTEILVVDNGSADPPSACMFRHLGAAVRVVAAPDPAPSPVGAVNHGLSLARGQVVGMWIDGARLASPGVCAAAVAVCGRIARAVVATPNFHLGHVPQYDPAARAHSRAAEDRLLERIAWPRDGYRLFEIASPAALSGCDGPMLETNTLFMRRAMWDEIGGYDAAFASPGGGAANADAFRRALERPGAALVKIAGEASFHQVHGGITSNAADAAATIRLVGREYAAVRGRGLGAWRGPSLIYHPATGRIGAEGAAPGSWSGPRGTGREDTHGERRHPGE